MESPTIAELIPVLQIAIAPVILISGVGLLLLTMTNRFGRIIDRARELAAEIRAGSAIAADDPRRRQIEILYRRSRLVRRAITLASACLLAVGVLIVVLFTAALMRWEMAVPLSGLFVVSVLCLVGSLVEFLRDVHLSLVALDLELERR